MRLVTALLDWIRAFLGRLRARALLKQRLPRGPTAPALRTALRTPADPAPGEYETVLLGAQIVRGAGPRRLLRLAALPPLLPEFSGVRPDRFRLDGDLRLPHERGAARTAADLPPPAPARGPPRPRTPLARAPISRVDPARSASTPTRKEFRSRPPESSTSGCIRCCGARWSSRAGWRRGDPSALPRSRRSEEHTSELQSR